MSRSSNEKLTHIYKCPLCGHKDVPYVINQHAHVCGQCGWIGKACHLSHFVMLAERRIKRNGRSCRIRDDDVHRNDRDYRCEARAISRARPGRV